MLKFNLNFISVTVLELCMKKTPKLLIQKLFLLMHKRRCSRWLRAWMPIAESSTEIWLMEKRFNKREWKMKLRGKDNCDLLAFFFLVFIFDSIDCFSEHAKFSVLTGSELWCKSIRHTHEWRVSWGFGSSCVLISTSVLLIMSAVN